MRRFPSDVRAQVGYELFRVQQGLEPSDWKPRSSVGAGVIELRVHTGQAFRVMYVTRFSEAIYVLHAFEKRTRRTSQVDIAVGRKRLRDLIQWRNRQ